MENTNKLRVILGPMRVPFLALAPACVFLGVAGAIWKVGSVNPLHVILTLIGAVAAHISVNALNEYYDFKSGLDLRTRRTPFSGGSGTLPANPDQAGVALQVGLISLAITGLLGVYFLLVWGWMLLPLGLLGLLLIYTYTIWLNRDPIACLIAPGMGFGTLMVMGAYFAVTGEYSWTAFFASLTPFFLVNNLLLLNQFPDLEADRTVGRKHLPIVIGRPKSAVVYTLFLTLTYLSIIIGVLAGIMPPFTLLGLLTIIFAIPAARTALQRPDDIEKLMPALGQNVLLNLITPVLVAVGFLIG